MKYRQTQDVSLDELVTQAHTLANKCQFGENELSECIIKLIIASNRYDGLRRDIGQYTLTSNHCYSWHSELHLANIVGFAYPSD